jgi:hypothetical protein
MNAPTPGTDAARLLDAMRNAYPDPVWDADSGLHMKANSRAADLRKLGFDVECVSRPIPGSRKRSWGYRLANVATATPSANAIDEPPAQASLKPHAPAAVTPLPTHGEALSLFAAPPRELSA